MCNVTADVSGQLFHLNYAVLAECTPLYVSVPLLCLLVASLLFFLKSTSDDFLGAALSVMCVELAIPHDVAGATLLAFGNGAPDVFASVAAFTHSSSPNSSLGVGSLLGGAAFVSTVVLGVVALSASEPVEIVPTVYGRDVVFLVAGLCWLAIIGAVGSANALTSSFFLILYGVYVVTIVWQTRRDRLRAEQSARRLEERRKRASSRRVAEDRESASDQDSLLVELEAVQSKPGENVAVLETILEDENGQVTLHLPPEEQLVENHFATPAATPSDADESGPKSSSLKSSSSLWTNLYWKGIRTSQAVRMATRSTAKAWRDMNGFERARYLAEAPLGALRAVTIPPGEGNGWTRWRIVLHPPMCTLLIFWLVTPHEASSITPAWVAAFSTLLTLSMVASLLVYFSVHELRAPTSRVARVALAAGSFTMCILWIYGVAGEVVSALDAMGAAIGADPSLLGLSLLAWANSVGDLYNNIAVVKAGMPQVAVAACVAGPTFNLLLGLGLSLTILCAKSSPVEIHLDRYSVAALLLLFTTLLLTFLASIANNRRMTRPFGYALLAAYGVYAIVLFIMFSVSK